MDNFVFRPESKKAVAAALTSATPQTGPATPSRPPAVPQAAHDAIARRAYDIYLKTGSKKGRCKQNWLQAERELNHATAAASSLRLTTAAPATPADLEPVMKLTAGAFPSIVGGRVVTTGGNGRPAPAGSKA